MNAKLPSTRSFVLFAAIAVGVCALTVRLFYWSPRWAWVSEVLAGTFQAEPAYPGRVHWQGLWEGQTLVFQDTTLEVVLSSFLQGKKRAVAEFGGGPVTGRFEIERPFFEPAEGLPAYCRARLQATAMLPAAIPILEEIASAGQWHLLASGSVPPEGVPSWEARWTGEDVLFEFGPRGRATPAGALRLARAEISTRWTGYSLKFTDIEGDGDGIEVRGDGQILLDPEPLRSQLDIQLNLARKLASLALSVPGWDDAILGTEEMELRIMGTVGTPEFYLNGFLLMEETITPAKPLTASDVTARLMGAALSNLGGKALPGDGRIPAGVPTVDNMESNQGLSERDIEKMKDFLKGLARERGKRQVEGHSAEYRRRWKELRRAYKQELKKMAKEGVDLKQEFGKKPNREMKKLIRERMNEEFPDNTLPDEQKGKEPQP